MWAITSYFNPFHYKTRRRNFERFAAGVACPLVVVELSCDGIFELSRDAATSVIPVHGQGLQSILFQKERLLNIGIRSIPECVENIAWLDCDVVMRRDWVPAADALLKEYLFCQLFEHVGYLKQDHSPDYPGYSCSHYGTSFINTQKGHGGNPGLACASRRSVLVRAGGLYEAMVLGGGDGAVTVAGACGFVNEIVEHNQLGDQHARHLRMWARSFYSLVGGRVAALPGTLYHLWHGAVEDRQYKTRYAGFREFNFNPDADLLGGEWAPHRTDLQNYALSYFKGRREDG